MAKRDIAAAYMDTESEAPLVSITMDLPGWEFLLSCLSSTSLEDECAQTIRRACAKAVVGWLPTIDPGRKE